MISLIQVAEQVSGGAPTCGWVITSLLTALGGAGCIIAFLAKLAWNQLMGRIADKEATIAQLNVAWRSSEKKGKGES